MGSFKKKLKGYGIPSPPSNGASIINIPSFLIYLLLGMFIDIFIICSSPQVKEKGKKDLRKEMELQKKREREEQKRKKEEEKRREKEEKEEKKRKEEERKKREREEKELRKKHKV